MRIVSFEIGTDPRFMCLVPLDNEDVNEIADMIDGFLTQILGE